MEESRRLARIQAHLAHLPLFKELPRSELEPIAQGTREVHALRGDTLFRCGDPCMGFHVVVYGRVKLVFVSSSGLERVVRLVGPGEGFGEALMFMERDYIVTAQALVDTLLLHVGRETVFERLDQSPGMARRMLAGLSQRLHRLMGELESYTLQNGAQRLVAYLLQEWPGEEGQPFRIDVGKSVIASRLNLTPEHLSRTLRDLMNRGLIRVQRRNFTILDSEALRQYRG
ncbi:Crp/Fnr family transcriptional regulator [Alcaligenes sp. SDU_A2]|uniref:Crp/Fnr family transcriptional regulator n=1 Tax=Alcaligenes sp. SDU_A2 TaxID=3136634 RepID=UPI002BF49CB0|nr:Crp/Fnr family transcriptional regulator [Alcaligenes sp.]HRL26180.1 Crp/Fnr family transcriptional regulator [Alcaligenes sp.]